MKIFQTQANVTIILGRVSVRGVKSLGSHSACLCMGFGFYEVKKDIIIFQKQKREILLHF